MPRPKKGEKPASTKLPVEVTKRVKADWYDNKYGQYRRTLRDVVAPRRATSSDRYGDHY